MHDLRVRVCVSVKVLLVTTLLSLVTMFDTVRNNSPDALELKCIEVNLFYHPLKFTCSASSLFFNMHFAHLKNCNKLISNNSFPFPSNRNVCALVLHWSYVTGVADIVHIVCVSSANGIFYCPVWYSIRQTLAN